LESAKLRYGEPYRVATVRRPLFVTVGFFHFSTSPGCGKTFTTRRGNAFPIAFGYHINPYLLSAIGIKKHKLTGTSFCVKVQLPE
jgi:hypothetical protein